MRYILMGVSALVFAQAAWAGPVLTTQAVSCLDGTTLCSGASSGTLNDSGNTMSWTGNTATAGFGILHVATDLTNYKVTNGQVISYGFVGFTDFLTISDPAKTGQTGTLNVSYFIDGQVGHTGASSAFLQVVTRVCTPQCTSPVPAADNYVADFNPSPLVPVTNYDETISIPKSFTFTYGTQFELFFSMQATTGTVNDDGNGGYSNPVVTSSGSGFSNFANTLILNGLQTGDPNATYSATSNTAYSAQGIVPEPASLVLAGGGLLLGIAAAKRRFFVRTQD